MLVVAGAVVLATTSEAAKRPRSASGVAAPVRKTLDLVWISDSVGWGVASFYARHIRRDLGVKVRVHDQWEGGLSAQEILARLRTGHFWVRLIRNAEVIVVSGNPTGTLGVDRDACVEASGGAIIPPRELGPQVWTRYVATRKAIYKRIFVIRKRKPVILRTNNTYVPVIYQAPREESGHPPVSWQQSGVVDVCTKFFESYSAAIATAAAAYRVPVADVYRAFNGESHLDDPVAKGYIQTDGIHPNSNGRTVFANTLARLGYKKVQPR